MYLKYSLLVFSVPMQKPLQNPFHFSGKSAELFLPELSGCGNMNIFGSDDLLQCLPL